MRNLALSALLLVVLACVVRVNFTHEPMTTGRLFGEVGDASRVVVRTTSDGLVKVRRVPGSDGVCLDYATTSVDRGIWSERKGGDLIIDAEGDVVDGRVMAEYDYLRLEVPPDMEVLVQVVKYEGRGN